jgi:hypothetical protein
VRQQLQEEFSVDLSDAKKEVDDLILEILRDMNPAEGDEEAENGDAGLEGFHFILFFSFSLFLVFRNIHFLTIRGAGTEA